MASRGPREAIEKSGLYFDELNKLRVVDPKATQECAELREQSVDFLTKLKAFESLVENFIKLVDALAKQVEQEKMRAIASRNMLKFATTERKAEAQQLQTLIREREVRLERLRLEAEMLTKQEAQQKEFLQQYLQP